MFSMLKGVSEVTQCHKLFRFSNENTGNVDSFPVNKRYCLLDNKKDDK